MSEVLQIKNNCDKCCRPFLKHDKKNDSFFIKGLVICGECCVKEKNSKAGLFTKGYNVEQFMFCGFVPNVKNMPEVGEHNENT